jgi:hypothetical protein
MGVPVRYPNGVATAPKDTMFGNFPSPSPANAAVAFTDFFQYIAAEWTVTGLAGGSVLTAGNGGRLLQSTTAAAGNIQFNTKTPAHALISPGSPFWFVWMGQVNDNASDVRVGMFAGGTPFAPTDGVFFEKLTAQDGVTLNIKTGAAVTTIPAVTTMAPLVDTALGFYYDGAATPTIQIFSSTPVPPQSAFGQPRVSGGYMVAGTQVLTNLPTSVLAVGFGLRATPAAIKTLNTDYVLAASDINRA